MDCHHSLGPVIVFVQGRTLVQRLIHSRIDTFRAVYIVQPIIHPSPWAGPVGVDDSYIYLSLSSKSDKKFASLAA